jgi:methylisocitrate lyase
MTAADLRALLAADLVTHVPGIWDPATAALAVRAGHRAVHLAGAAIAATELGRSGHGVTPASQIADRAALVAPALGGVPMLADAEAGYDSPGPAVWTALAYQRAGISGLLLGDGGAPAESAAARIAELARQVPDVVVIARAAGAGPEEIIDRGRRYAAAGADAVLPAGVPEADLDRLHRALPGVPLVIDRSETAPGGRRRGDAELAAAGVRLVLHPLAAMLAALRAASVAYRAIAEEGGADRVDRLPPAAYATLVPPGSEKAAPESAAAPEPPGTGAIGT